LKEAFAKTLLMVNHLTQTLCLPEKN
jgi:hypothetical protein